MRNSVISGGIAMAMLFLLLRPSGAGCAETSATGSLITDNRLLITNSPTVGMEGKVEVTLPGTALEARPVESKARRVKVKLVVVILCPSPDRLLRAGYASAAVLASAIGLRRRCSRHTI